jgi:putative MFS transporter
MTTEELSPQVGPAESKHINSRRYQDVISGDRVTTTHWFIAWAGGLGFMIESMGTAVYALIIPQLLDDFDADLNQLTFALFIVGLVSAGATYFWPWLADRIGRRPCFIINIVLCALSLVLVALSWSWLSFIAFYGLYLCAQVGEWGVAACLISETWPARRRASVLSFARSFYGYGAALAGLLGVTLVATIGWRYAFLLPAGVAFLALFVRFFCPESPYWLRARDRRTRLRAAVARGEQVSAEDSAWQRKAEKPGLGQLFLADQRRRTIVAIFVPVIGLMAFTIVGAWQPLYLHNELGWTTSEYSLYTIWWGLAGTLGYYLFGWIADHRSRLSAMFAGNLLCIVTIIPWALSTEPWAIYTFGLLANVGLIGVWGTIMTYTAELFPTRIRGLGQGISWGTAGLISKGVPFLALLISDVTGSFQLAFLLIPVLLIIQLIGLVIAKTEYAGKELDEIAV